MHGWHEKQIWDVASVADVGVNAVQGACGNGSFAMVSERRSAPRVRFAAKVTLIRSNKAYIQTVGCNISTGGLAVHASAELYNGEPVSILFALRHPDTGESREFSFQAEVTYIVRVTNPTPANMLGLRFVSPNESDIYFLVDYINATNESLRSSSGIFPNFLTM